MLQRSISTASGSRRWRALQSNERGAATQRSRRQHMLQCNGGEAAKQHSWRYRRWGWWLASPSGFFCSNRSCCVTTDETNNSRRRTSLALRWSGCPNIAVATSSSALVQRQGVGAVAAQFTTLSCCGGCTASHWCASWGRVDARRDGGRKTRLHWHGSDDHQRQIGRLARRLISRGNHPADL